MSAQSSDEKNNTRRYNNNITIYSNIEKQGMRKQKQRKLLMSLLEQRWEKDACIK